MSLDALDAHCHADILLSQEPDFVSTYQGLNMAVISWSYAHAIGSWRDYPAYWTHVRTSCEQLRTKGIPAFYLVGIHPRCIPQDLKPWGELPHDLEKSLKEHMAHPLCRGLGELGLETGEDPEKWVLERHLQIALSDLPQGKKIGLHTPRNNKEPVTDVLLEMLSTVPSLAPCLLVDHLTPSTWQRVWEAGYMLGMTLQKGKSTLQDVLAVFNKAPKVQDRLMLNSDGARELSRPFVHCVQNGEVFDPQQRQKLLCTNAWNFFGLDAGGVPGRDEMPK